jgi:hypothetical protein
MPIDKHTADTDVRSVNANHGANDEDNEGRSGGQGGGSANDEMGETHPVDDKDIVSHVFLPMNRRMCVSFISTRI